MASSKIREISEEFIMSLNNKELSMLTQIVRYRDELIMCFRYGYINVYHNSHSLFRITEQKENYLVEFNMGHARYTDPAIRDKYWAELKKEIPDIRYNKNSNIAAFRIKKDGTVFDFRKVTNIYLSFIDDFFGTTKTRKNCLTEKRHQQRLFSEYFGEGRGYLFFDMEYAIPRDSKLQTPLGFPDCLALKMDKQTGLPTAILLVEIKSTKSACVGKCGISSHLKKYDKMIAAYSNVIRESAKEAVDLYNSLGLLNIPSNAAKKIPHLPLKKLFVFTSKEVEVFYTDFPDKSCEKLFVDYD